MSDTLDPPPPIPKVFGTPTDAEMRTFKEVVRTLGQWPPYLKRIDVRFGIDSNDEPALWMIFRTTADLQPSSEKIATIRGLVDRLRTEILHNGIERFPYLEIAASEDAAD